MFIMMNIASQAQSVEMADTMRSNGKIYVVVVVAAVVSTVLSIYMISIDKKVAQGCSAFASVRVYPRHGCQDQEHALSI